MEITILLCGPSVSVNPRQVSFVETGAVLASDEQTNRRLNGDQVIKRTVISGLIAAALLLGGMAMSASAGNGPGNGRGHGGPPKSDEERAARQAGCLQKNGGVCPNGGPRAPGQCNGQGQSQGKDHGRGLRDGTGPRAGTGNCPLNKPAEAQK